MRVDTLRGHPVLDSTHVINPAAIQVSGDRLYLKEGYVSSAPFVRVFRIGSWDEEWAFGRKGSGPAEFGSLSVELVPALNGDLWVYEFGRRQLTRLARYPDHGELVPDTFTVQFQPFHQRISRMAWLSADTLIGYVFNAERGIFGLISSDGELLAEIGGPPPGDERVPAHIRSQHYHGFVAVHPSGNRFAFALNRVSKLSIHGRDGDVITVADAPFDFESGYRYSGGVLVSTSEKRRAAYNDVVATNDRIFALFSGRAIATQGVGAIFVHEFDWSGNFLRVFRLKGSATSIAVDESGTNLFAYHPNPTPEVWQYSIPPTTEAR